MLLPAQPVFADDHSQVYRADYLGLEMGKELLDLTITSPPYNLDKPYVGYKDKQPSYDDYLCWSAQWLDKLWWETKLDGRLALNIPFDSNVDGIKEGIRALYHDIFDQADLVGWKYLTTIIWHKYGTNQGTAWGSWCSPSLPYVIAPVEAVLVFYKKHPKHFREEGRGGPDITKEQFLEYTHSIWTIPPAKRAGHPCPFPKELPYRLMKLYSYPGDVVFDPFCGSGTTLIAAREQGRQGIGCEVSPEYANLTITNLKTIPVSPS